MRRTIPIILCLSLLFVPVSAQDATCNIDLASTVALLVQAQASAAGGDTEAALTQIAQAQSKLDAFADLCGSPEDIDGPATPVELELTQTYTFEDFNGDTTFSFPAGWVQTEDSGGVLIGTSNEVVSRDFDSEPPPFASGEAAIYLIVDTAGGFGPGDAQDPVALLETLRSQVPPSFGSSTAPVAVTVNDRPAALFTISGAATDLMLMSVELGTFDGEPVFVQFIMLTAPGELNAFETTLQAVAETVTFTP